MRADPRAGRSFALAALAMFAALTPAFAQRKALDVREQALVNAAIDAGVGFLKRSQNLDGTWPRKDNSHTPGYTALPALTLLECEVPPNDPAIKKSAALLRKVAPSLDKTYEIALTILFLDRLGDRSDRALIQLLASRLIAGQTVTGGWGYKCPLISRADQTTILTALRKLEPGIPLMVAQRPADGPMKRIDRPAKGGDRELDKVAGGNKGGGLDGRPVKGGNGGLDKVVGGGGNKPALGGTTKGESSSPGERGSTVDIPDKKTGDRPADNLPEKKADDPDKKADNRPAEERQPQPLRLAGRRWNGCIREVEGMGQSFDQKPAAPVKVADLVPARLRNLPVFAEGPAVLVDPDKRASEPLMATTDNSNTQFAILALWTASRHDVPMTRTMKLVVRRFQTSQNENGGWGYRYRFGGGVAEGPAMTCVGLLGLAVGQALMEQPAAQDKIDPAILKGFVALSKHVGVAVDGNQKPDMANLYLLWSIERVAVLYDLPTIANKDWYRWAAQVLVAHQQEGGHWQDGGYHAAHPVIDTSLSLLVLKRVNLARDLGERLAIDPRKLDRAIIKVSAPAKEKESEPKREEESKIKPTLPPTNNPDKGFVTQQPSGAKPEGTMANTPRAGDDYATEAASPSRSGWPWWLFVVLALSAVALGGGVTCVVIHLKKGGGEEEEDERPRRKKRKKG